MNDQISDLELMSMLDKGTNMFGALSAEVRSRLFAVVDDTTVETWEDAHGIIINARKGFMGMTLWQALLRYTTYQVNAGPPTTADGQRLGEWSRLPTREELLTALVRGTE